MNDQNFLLSQVDASSLILVAYRFSFFLVKCISDHSVAAFGGSRGGFPVGNLRPIAWTDVRYAPMTATSITRYQRLSDTHTCISYMLFVIVLCGKYCPY